LCIFIEILSNQMKCRIILSGEVYALILWGMAISGVGFFRRYLYTSPTHHAGERSSEAGHISESLFMSEMTNLFAFELPIEDEMRDCGGADPLEF
jgi:hypothetical protein